VADDNALKALNLRLAGVDWHTIADRLGYNDAVDALEAAEDIANSQYDGMPTDPLRVLAILRLDRLRAAVWPAALKGDAAAIDRVLAIDDRQNRLLRLSQRSTP